MRHAAASMRARLACAPQAMLWRGRALPPLLQPRLLPRISAQVCTAAVSVQKATVQNVLAAHVVPAATVKAHLPSDAHATELALLLEMLSRLGVTDLPNVLQREPTLLGCRVQEDILPRIQYLLDLGIQNVGSCITKAPRLLTCDLKTDVHDKIRILELLGVSDIAHWISSNPNIVDLDIENDMRPAVQYLRSVGVEKDALGKILSTIPGSALKVSQLQRVVDYLAEIRVKPIVHVISRNPEILAYNPEKLQSKVDWLQGHIKNPAAVIALNPKVLNFSPETLTLKLEYILGEMQYSIKEVTEFPQSLNYSVKQMKLRFEFLKESRPDFKPNFQRFLRVSRYQFVTKMCKRPFEDWDFYLERKGMPPLLRPGERFKQAKQLELKTDAKINDTISETRGTIHSVLQLPREQLPGIGLGSGASAGAGAPALASSFAEPDASSGAGDAAAEAGDTVSAEAGDTVSAEADGKLSAEADGKLSAEADGKLSAEADGKLSAEAASGPADAPTSGPADAPTSGPADAPTSGPADAPTEPSAETDAAASDSADAEQGTEKQ